MSTPTPPPSSPTPPDPEEPGAEGTQPQEHDPTGVRALLAGLPDPGPMPEHLVRRIEARLEVEQAHRSAGGHPLGTHADRVVDLAADRSRRRPGRTLALLGAAAAGLVVTTVALTQTLGGSGTDAGTAAQYPSPDAGQGSDDAADAAGEAGAAGGADAAESESAPDMESDTELGALESSPVVVLTSLGRVGPDDLGASLRQAHGTRHDPEAQPALTTGEAMSCWSAVDQGWAERYAAPAEYLPTDGGVEDVVVLLGLSDDGSGWSWVVPADCVSVPEVAPLDPAGEPVDAP